MICPICKHELSITATSAVCENSHSFDKAKEGYFNLLTTGGKNSANPGDNKEMVIARRDFLRLGFYSPLSDRINSLAYSLYCDSESVNQNELLNVDSKNTIGKNKELQELNGGTTQNEPLYNIDSKNTIDKNQTLQDLKVGVTQKTHLYNARTQVTPDKIKLLDAGCSVGYYASRTYEYFIKKGMTGMDFFAFDISKEAIKVASKADKNISFFVASVYDIPLKSESIDIAFSVFSPTSPSLCDVIKKGGYLIIALPREEHLRGIKESLYETVRLKSEKVPEMDGMSITYREAISYEVTLKSSTDIKNLLLMTPYYYKSPKYAVEGTINKGELTTKLDFELILYKKD